MLRKLAVLRGVPPGAPVLLPGVLACAFDLRRQQGWKVRFSPDAQQNEKPGAPEFLADLPRGSLILADLGFPLRS